MNECWSSTLRCNRPMASMLGQHLGWLGHNLGQQVRHNLFIFWAQLSSCFQACGTGLLLPSLRHRVIASKPAAQQLSCCSPHTTLPRSMPGAPQRRVYSIDV